MFYISDYYLTEPDMESKHKPVIMMDMVSLYSDKVIIAELAIVILPRHATFVHRGENW